MSDYKHHFLFHKKNFVIVLIGLAVMLLGFFAMMLAPNTDPTVYNEKELYGFRTTVLAPVLVLLGLVIQVVAIMMKPKNLPEKEV
ncbi:MAG: DUF3098 domain-containing protein [Chitinophagales bacterium]|nr:DUF3098 domain-containing protein [Bacteroidota bacterium]MCB9043025.1 DUF3098 domain-containing protein [Chitinophagales bacterium]